MEGEEWGLSCDIVIGYIYSGEEGKERELVL